MSSSSTQQVPTDIAHEQLSRDELVALLRDVTQQRDNLLSQYEAMALQVDESVRDIATEELDVQQSEKKAEASERHAQQEATRATELSHQLDEERRKRAEIADEFARFREVAARTPVEDPWGALWRSVLQIVSDGVAWARAKFPPDSALLPWFDRAIALLKAVGRLAFAGGRALFDWAKPHILELWKRLKTAAPRQ
mgnify:CR=1 FL=1